MFVVSSQLPNQQASVYLNQINKYMYAVGGSTGGTEGPCHLTTTPPRAGRHGMFWDTS